MCCTLLDPAWQSSQKCFDSAGIDEDEVEKSAWLPRYDVQTLPKHTKRTKVLRERREAHQTASRATVSMKIRFYKILSHMVCLLFSEKFIHSINMDG